VAAWRRGGVAAWEGSDLVWAILAMNMGANLSKGRYPIPVKDKYIQLIARVSMSF
jgi:hypothetical protein